VDECVLQVDNKASALTMEQQASLFANSVKDRWCSQLKTNQTDDSVILSAGYNFKEDPLATALILQTLSNLTTKKFPESFEGLRNKT
jgi:hypothetical protein